MLCNVIDSKPVAIACPDPPLRFRTVNVRFRERHESHTAHVFSVTVAGITVAHPIATMFRRHHRSRLLFLSYGYVARVHSLRYAGLFSELLVA